MAEACRKRRTGIGRLAEATLLAFAFAMMLLASTSGASAHATLIRSTPADGSVSAKAPTRLSLVFSEPVSPIALRLIGPDGTATALTRFELKGSTLEIEAPAVVPDGTSALSWRVVSEDGHPIGGTVVFSVGAPSKGAPAPDDAVDPSVRAAIWIAKTALYIGLFLGVGGAFAVAWLGGGRTSGSSFAAGAMLLGLAAAPLSLGLQGVDALGATLSGLAQPIAWATGWSTSYGRTAAIAAIALALGLASLACGRMSARALSAVALLGVGTALAASGHASAAAPQWLTRPMVFLHGAGVAFWAGALAPLGLALCRRDEDAPAMLRRFSRAIPFALVPLVASGLTLAAIQLGSPTALGATAYGQVFLGKTALLAVLLSLAAYNRLSLTGRAEGGDARGLVRSIAFETVLVVAILAVAALWRFTPPPRALAEAAAEPASVHIHTAKAMADLSVTPGRAGPTTASIVIMTGEFGPLDAKEVTLVLANPALGIEPIRRQARKPGDGTWRIDALAVPAPGRWSARIDILVSDFELVTLEGELDIRR